MLAGQKGLSQQVLIVIRPGQCPKEHCRFCIGMTKRTHRTQFNRRAQSHTLYRDKLYCPVSNADWGGGEGGNGSQNCKSVSKVQSTHVPKQRLEDSCHVDHIRIRQHQAARWLFSKKITSSCNGNQSQEDEAARDPNRID